MNKDDYLKMIIDFLNEEQSHEEYLEFYNNLVAEADYADTDKQFINFLLELDDLAEEFEYSTVIEDMEKYDKRLITIMKKYNYM